MICVSIAETTLEKCLKALEGVDFAEVRLEKMKVDVQGVKALFSSHPRLIATCRPGDRSDEERKALLLAAVDAGAAYVDVEVESNDLFRRTVVDKAISKDCRIIVSYHDFEKTPRRAELEHIINWCFESGAHIAKIACMTHSREDSARLLGLLQDDRSLIVIGMGDQGKITRIMALLLGSPFMYASSHEGKETASGQINAKAMKKVWECLKNV